MASKFMTEDNLDLIWSIFNDNTPDVEDKLKQVVFNDNLRPFHNANKTSSDLLGLNKRYISFILDKIQSAGQKQKVVITNSAETYEHIQQTKIENFNRELKQKQDEFTDIIQKKVPPTPVFADDTDGYNSKFTFEQLVEDRKNNIMPLNMTLPTLRKSVVVNEDEMTDEINVIDLSNRYNNKLSAPSRKKITWDDTNSEPSDNLLGFFKKKLQVDEVLQKDEKDKYLDVIAELKNENIVLNEKIDRLLVIVEEIKSRTCV
uniref:Uncharacterized protein n=1 Tax=viral metagenome TaxID=1070528 RepID=A0A6C0E799_9ZZZZ